MLLFIDTETTGLIDYKRSIADPAQPHIVQLAAILTDDDGAEIDRLDTIVAPDGWTIPPAATAVHGISTERAADEGQPIATVLRTLLALVAEADADRAGRMIAHNYSFDYRMLLRELSGDFAPLSALTPFCTMQALTDRMALPGRYGKPKWPRLDEAYRFMFNTMFADAHSAIADCEACRDIFSEGRWRGWWK